MKKIFILCLVVSLTGCYNQPQPVITGQEGKALPDFGLLLMDSTTQLNSAAIPQGSSFVVFFFSPFCPFCRAQTQEMIDHFSRLKETKVYFLSPFPFHLIKDYYIEYKLGQYSNFVVGQDVNSSFGNFYQVKGFPYIAIYNGEKKLKEVVMGNVGTKAIMHIVERS